MKNLLFVMIIGLLFASCEKENYGAPDEDFINTRAYEDEEEVAGFPLDSCQQAAVDYLRFSVNSENGQRDAIFQVVYPDGSGYQFGISMNGSERMNSDIIHYFNDPEAPRSVVYFRNLKEAIALRKIQTP